MSSRSYCFTLFKLTNKFRNVDWKEKIEDKKGIGRYIVFQLEKCPETGKKHIQGYVELNRNYTLKMTKEWLGFETMHLEKRRGTREEARAYCKKEESRIAGPWEFGDWAAGGAGTRNDLSDVKKKIDNGADFKKLCDENFNECARYNRFFKEYIEMKTPKTTREVEVIMLYGDNNLDFAYENWDDIYRLVNPGKKSMWFDAYQGEKHLLIDDFDGWISFSELKPMLEKYPLRIQYKGGSTTAKWEKVIISSDKLPNEWNYTPSESLKVQRLIPEVIKIHGGGAEIYNLRGGLGNTIPSHKKRTLSYQEKQDLITREIESWPEIILPVTSYGYDDE